MCMTPLRVITWESSGITKHLVMLTKSPSGHSPGVRRGACLPAAKGLRVWIYAVALW